MAYLHTSKSRLSSGEVRANRSHSLASRALFLWQFRKGLAKSNVGLRRSTLAWDNSNVSIVQTDKGPALHTLSTTTGNSYLVEGSETTVIHPQHITVFAVVRTSDEYGSILTLRNYNDGNPILSLMVGKNGVVTSAGRFLPIARDDGGNLSYNGLSGTLIHDGLWHIVAIGTGSTGNWQWSVDGSAWTAFDNVGTVGTSVTIDAQASGLMNERYWVLYGTNTNEERVLGGDLLCAGVVPKVFADTSLLKAILIDPDQLFEQAPARRTYFIPAAGAAPVFNPMRGWIIRPAMEV